MKLKMLILVGILAVGLPMILLAQTTVNTVKQNELVCSSADNSAGLVNCLNEQISALIQRVKLLENRIKVLEAEKTTPPTVLKSCPVGCKCSDSGVICPNPDAKTDNGNLPSDNGTNVIQISPTETKVIQQFLNVKSDGIFGQKTKAAVNVFQTTQGLTATGLIDQNTLEKMKVLAPTIAPSVNASLQQVQ